MALIALAADKGAPGVTTTAVALAAVWPRRAVLAECDPAGGDLVYRAAAEDGGPLNPNVGMLSLATAARHGLSAQQVGAHVQRVHGGLEVVAGLATGDQSAGLAGLWGGLGRAFDALPDADVIADCGRVEAGSPTLELMAGAAVVLLVARATAEQIAHVRDRAVSLVQRVGGGNALNSGGLGVPIGVVLIVDPRKRGRVVEQVDGLLRGAGLPVKVVGTIADDPDGAGLLNGQGRGRLDKTLLVRSAREVAQDVAERFAAGRATAPPPPQASPAPGAPSTAHYSQSPEPGPQYGEQNGQPSYRSEPRPRAQAPSQPPAPAPLQGVVLGPSGRAVQPDAGPSVPSGPAIQPGPGTRRAAPPAGQQDLQQDWQQPRAPHDQHPQQSQYQQPHSHRTQPPRYPEAS